jgi:hypothetical protein
MDTAAPAKKNRILHRVRPDDFVTIAEASSLNPVRVVSGAKKPDKVVWNAYSLRGDMSICGTVAPDHEDPIRLSNTVTNVCRECRVQVLEGYYGSRDEDKDWDAMVQRAEESITKLVELRQG